MSSTNGHKPRMDVNLLTPNDYRRLRAKLDGRDLDALLASGQPEDVVQTLILGFKLREDPGFTWEQAGDTTAADVFDMTDRDREPDPPTAPAGSPGPEPAPKRASGSNKRPRATASEPN